MLVSHYVPVFDGKWNDTKSYDPFTLVSWKGNSYISKTFVPAHTDIQNDGFWALYE